MLLGVYLVRMPYIEPVPVLAAVAPLLILSIIGLATANARVHAAIVVLALVVQIFGFARIIFDFA